ncbi:transforming growth factor beta regulator 1 [Chamberlinius hualienensis]
MSNCNSLVVDLSPPSDDNVNNLEIMSHSRDPNRYRLKYSKFKKMIKDTIFENAALCDEVAKINEQIVKAKEERRFLLKKLFHLQSLHEAGNQSLVKSNVQNVVNIASVASSGSTTNIFSHIKTTNESSETNKPKRKVLPKKTTKDILDASLKSSNKRKRSGTPAKRHAQLVPLDSCGRPIFPIDLGGLTVHSLGEIVSDRSAFHSEDHIYPVGFCSTRIYASTKNAEVKCLFTCKISDDGNEPKFEIAADDNPEHPITGKSAGECHTKLLKAVSAFR